MSGVGITFDETHSFRDWGLRLKKIVIGIPKAKTEYVSVPGMNGDLDLSEAQNGGVKYEMRTLKFTFGARNCSYERWSGLLSQIASDLQGISKRIILDTDKGYYYTGRCEIETEKNNLGRCDSSGKPQEKGRGISEICSVREDGLGSESNRSEPHG